LSQAAEKGHVEIVKLLQNGARPDFEDEPGKTPLSRAKNARNTAVIALLNSIS
jgi:ankyrin repeat protein